MDTVNDVYWCARCGSIAWGDSDLATDVPHIVGRVECVLACGILPSDSTLNEFLGECVPKKDDNDSVNRSHRVGTAAPRAETRGSNG